MIISWLINIISFGCTLYSLVWVAGQFITKGREMGNKEEHLVMALTHNRVMKKCVCWDIRNTDPRTPLLAEPSEFVSTKM